MNRLPKFCLFLLAVTLLLGLTLPALAAEAKGKIKSVDADKNEFVFTDTDGKDWTFHATKECKVLINDKESKLSDLKAGDEATVTYEKKDEKLVASEVRATRK
jgi:Cu/Ag efflux protein CusF